MGKKFWATAIPSLLYLGLAFACLVQWGSLHPWSRLNVFSGGYLALRLLGSVHSVVSGREAFKMRRMRQAWWGTDSSPGWTRWVALLMAADLAIFLDYGHLRLTPGLERGSLQGVGLGLYVLAAVWQIWTDRYLARYFTAQQSRLSPIDKGPFRYVRHPRYAAAILGKAALALVFASAIGWLLAFAWGVLLTRKLRIEEEHLRRRWGDEYDAYAGRTARLLPGIY